MTPITDLEHLANPLVTAEQLYSLHDDDRSRVENGQSLRYAQALLTQAAGVLLRLPQEVIATSLVVLQRFWVDGHGQGHRTADLTVHIMLDILHIHKLKGSCRRLQKRRFFSPQKSPSPLFLFALFAMCTPICFRPALLYYFSILPRRL